MSNQVHHAIWHRETYSAEGVLECLSGMPFDVEFISFDDVKKGIPKDIRVIINVGDAYTSFSGAENWIDEAVVTTLRQFVDEGGGFIGDGEYSQLVVNQYGKGHGVYFAGLPYSPQNCRILLRAIYYAAGMEQEMKRYYVTNVDTEVTVFQKTQKIAVINNSGKECQTDLYINGDFIVRLTLEPGEMRWLNETM